ncbi:cytochrome c [Ureibacillus sp. FSL K6-8385]|uniref:Cytochrome c n=1 Tax=Ureibacillus terrenus TaxID=118246 RepID=A0A540V2E1_9BACL|nr:cytochrome c [Ureibacillus terrenus]MED3661371.1 cytochrome c [Ureibacillus terrenus]MED3764158.1 cytochrome c [Ureibacillus terrenus]TQE90888.1 cytochrome c [Ureibacillus terrenus]
MKPSKVVLATFVGLGLIGLGACGNDEEGKKAEVNEELAAEGEKIVKSSCASCHGVDLTGDLGPNLHNLTLSKEQIMEVLRKGGKTMPPGTANGKEEAVAEYLLTLKE